MDSRYCQTTNGISIYVEPRYLESQSVPAENRYIWAYAIEIVNNSKVTIQLQERTWDITDATGKHERVQGPGVVGEQPILNPGDRFRYSSGCPLTTSSGFMEGSFTMQLENGERFEAIVPSFALDLPNQRPMMN